jgi:hypothetical protein
MSRDGNLRASDADRELAVSMLQQAAAEGRLDPDELDDRVQRALRARTYAELAQTVVDLPVVGDRRRRGRGQDSGPAWVAGAPSRRRTAGDWTVRTVRANPMLLLVVILALAMLAGGRTRTVVTGRTRTLTGNRPPAWAMSWSHPRPGRPVSRRRSRPVSRRRA